MSLYPSLEDMKVDHMIQAQAQLASQMARADSLPYPISTIEFDQQASHDLSLMYPALNDYMGIEFTQDVIAANMPEYLSVAQNWPRSATTAGPIESHCSMIAPLSGSSIGLQRAQVTHGIREVVLCKGEDGKVGLRVKDVNKGIFVSLVKRGSPAALAGLRFGDQILQINGQNVAGYSMDKVHDVFRKVPENGINLAVRDRPFERTITLHKDSTNHVGFQFKDGEINTLVKDSSAARNGLLTNHYLLEVNGQNVVGLKDKEITAIFNESGQIITITVMPSFIYNHITKHMASSLVTKFMDHSVPDL